MKTNSGLSRSLNSYNSIAPLKGELSNGVRLRGRCIATMFEKSSIFKLFGHPFVALRHFPFQGKSLEI